MAYFCTALDAFDRLSERGVQLRLDDRPSAMAQHLRRAKNTIRRYLIALYSDTALQADADAGGVVNDLATTLAVAYLCERRANARPGSIEAAAKEALETLQAIHEQQAVLPDVAARAPSSPVHSNIRVIPGYVYRKIRVETPISSPAPTGYTQIVDWASVSYVEY